MSLIAAGLLSPSTIFAILKVAFGFGLVIFIHELGHYLAARKNGVFVEKFAIGFDFFGAKLFSWERGGTEYVIGALPLGGYVKMKGQNDLPDSSNRPDDSDSFQSKSVWQRTQIISAGVVANFASAFALCWLAMVVGYHSYPAEVGSVSFDTLQEGLRAGDVIVEVEGSAIRSWSELVMAYATREPGSRIPVTIERDGEQQKLSLEVTRDPRMPINAPEFQRSIELRVRSSEVGSAADTAGILPGDLLVAVDGRPVTSWSEFNHRIQRRADTQMTLTIERVDPAGQPQVLDLVATPGSRPARLVPELRLDVEPDHPPVLDFVEEGSTGWVAGLRPGDRVLKVGATEVHSWYGLWRHATWSFGEDEPVPLTVSRTGAEPFEVAVTPGPIPDWGLGTDALPQLGVAGRPAEKLVIGRLGPQAPEQLRVGDVIVAVRGTIEGDGAGGVEGTKEWGVEDPAWITLLGLSGMLAEPRMELEVARGGKRHTFTVDLIENPDTLAHGYLGVGPVDKEILVKLGPVEAIVPSLKAPFRILREFVQGLRAMALRRASAKMLAGPVGILQATYWYAEKSTGDLANFLALLSVNLAVVNFLPIPITDGGHFVFLMYERLKGRRMEEELEARFQWAGLVFILLIFLFATFNDLGRIFGF